MPKKKEKKEKIAQNKKLKKKLGIRQSSQKKSPLQITFSVLLCDILYLPCTAKEEKLSETDPRALRLHHQFLGGYTHTSCYTCKRRWEFLQSGIEKMQFFDSLLNEKKKNPVNASVERTVSFLRSHNGH